PAGDVAYLGVSSEPVSAISFGAPVDHGAVVVALAPAGPAAKAGIKAGDIPAQLNGASVTLGGDIIVKVDGLRVASLDQLRTIVADKKPGDSVELELYRSTSTLDVKVKLGRQPSTPLC
ncbi:MAG: PDZ domain-containing protein, partial [Gaiellaceae bacterium]